MKNISFSLPVRAAAFALALVFLVLSVAALYDAFYDLYQVDPDPEALLTARYEDTDAYRQWLNNLLWDVMALLEEGGQPSAALRLDEAGVLYRVQAGDALYTNAGQYSAEDLTPADGRWIAVDGGEITVHLLYDGLNSPWDFSALYYSYYSDPAPLQREDLSILLHVPADLVAVRQQQWSADRELLLRALGRLLLCAAPFLLLNVFLCVVTGRRPDGALRAGRLDRLWTEPLAAALAAVAVITFWRVLTLLGRAFPPGWGQWTSRSAVIILCSLALGGGYCLGAPLLFALVRKVKARRFFRHSAAAALLRRVVRLYRGVLAFVRGLFDGSAYRALPLAAAMFRRRLAYVLGSLACVLVFLFGLSASSLFFCLAAMALELAATWWFLKSDNQTLRDLTLLVEQIGRIAGGDLSWQPPAPLGPQLEPVSRQLSEIGGGMQKSVEKQMQSERMKVELVTNVSHDLKTPLTSIISYVELLSKVGDLPPEARDYVAILAQKSDRLKSLVYDLFELAKSTSGSMEMQCEALGFHRLVEQTLAEMQERIDQSGLGLRLSLADPPVTIWADGRKMYRVLQNVIDNALKYSLPGTRIYADLTVQGGEALLTVKNTAGYEMDFSAEEITERFVRGDKARTAEGSGLGLSIAQSFTQACGGNLRVAVDGDQFKVFIRFSLYGAPSAGPSGPEAKVS